MLYLLRLSVLLMFVVGTAFVIITPKTSATPNAEAGFDALSSPRSLYVQNCATCHGSNGKAQTARGRKLEADDLTSEESRNHSTARVIRSITNGHGKHMPAFRGRLTSAQITAIAGYVKSL